MTTGTDPPGMLGEYVNLYAPMTEAPDRAHLGVAIATVSAAIGWKAHSLWGGAPEPATLSVVLVGGSATAKKTTVARSAEGLVRQALNGTPTDEIRLKARQMPGHISQAGMYDMIGPKDQNQADQWNLTPPPGHLLVWDEMATVLGKPGDTKNSDYLGAVRVAAMHCLNGHLGGTRTKGVDQPESRCAVSIVGTMTLADLEQRTSSNLINDGFLGRFLLLNIDNGPHRPRYLAFPPERTADVIERERGLAGWLHDLAQDRTLIGDYLNAFTPEARSVRETWYTDTARALEDQVATGDETARILHTVFGRIQMVAAKVALIAAVAEWRPPTSLAQLKITASHARFGISFAHDALHTIRLLAGTAGPDHDRDAYVERLVKYLTRRPSERITMSRLLKETNSSRYGYEERKRILYQLVEEGSANITVEKTGGRDAYVVTLPNLSPEA